MERGCRPHEECLSTLKMQSFRPARPIPKRTRRVCLSLRGHGRKRLYKSERPSIDHDRLTEASAAQRSGGQPSSRRSKKN
jgi:hypothetical protein